jgi:formate dehydrogenase subunit gamma
MSHTSIPLPERQRLRQKLIKKHNLANILTHWFNVASWLMLLPTGIAIISSPRLGITPIWWQEAFRNLFGSDANLIRFHYTIGFIWIFVILFNVFIGFRKYFVPFAAHRMLLDKDDIEWMKTKPLQMMGFMKEKPLPPQDAYNAGQKVYSYFVVICTLGIMVSGPVMVFKSLFPPIVKQIAQPIHFYMGAVFPEEKEAFFSMFSGKVSAWYARAHHEKWYNEKLKEEMEWEDQVEAEVQKSQQLADEHGGPD